MIRSWRSRSESHPGTLRSRNHDRVVDPPELGVWAVADGAGAYDQGEIASGMLASALSELTPGLTPSDRMAEVLGCIASVHETLRRRAAVDRAKRGNRSLSRPRSFSCLRAVIIMRASGPETVALIDCET